MQENQQTEFICIFHFVNLMVLVIDPQVAGISGDMLLSSLVHLGANKEKIINGVKTAESFLDGSKINKINFVSITKNGIHSTKLVLDLDENIHERKGSDIKNCIIKTAEKLNLSQKAINFSISSIQTLISAESNIHGESHESVHFHEAASIDTVIDIVGTAIALDDLGLFEEKIICLPVAIGGGFVNFSHGKVSNPTSAILEIFKDSNIVIFGGQITEELCTPTGASMLVNLVSSCNTYYPPINVNSIGYGAGEKNFDGFSNVLKITRGKEIPNMSIDSISVLETNLDDVSGEIIGSLIEKLMKIGAKDVTVVNGITKKGRPTFILSVMCSQEISAIIAETIFQETGTLGIRIRSSERIIKERTLKSNKISIKGKDFVIRYKESKLGDVLDFKIEFDDIQFVAKELQISIRESERLITKSLFG